MEILRVFTQVPIIELKYKETGIANEISFHNFDAILRS